MKLLEQLLIQEQCTAAKAVLFEYIKTLKKSEDKAHQDEAAMMLFNTLSIISNQIPIETYALTRSFAPLLMHLEKRDFNKQLKREAWILMDIALILYGPKFCTSIVRELNERSRMLCLTAKRTPSKPPLREFISIINFLKSMANMSDPKIWQEAIEGLMIYMNSNCPSFHNEALITFKGLIDESTADWDIRAFALEQVLKFLRKLQANDIPKEDPLQIIQTEIKQWISELIKTIHNGQMRFNDKNQLASILDLTVFKCPYFAFEAKTAFHHLNPEFPQINPLN